MVLASYMGYCYMGYLVWDYYGGTYWSKEVLFLGCYYDGGLAMVRVLVW